MGKDGVAAVRTDPSLELRILGIRGIRVILDVDLARLFGVTTKALNQAVKRNEGIQNRSQIVTGSQRHRNPRLRPLAFTEHGALMAANVLRNDRAVRMSIYVVRAFVRLREEAAARAGFLRRLAEIDRKLIAHDDALRDVYQKLLPLLAPPPDAPKRRIGFHTDNA